MSERGTFRGGRGGGGRGGGEHRGGGRGGGRGGAHGGQAEKPKKENILDLSKYMDKQIIVKFNGGREGKLFTRRPCRHIGDRVFLPSSCWCPQGLRSAHESGAG